MGKVYSSHMQTGFFCLDKHIPVSVFFPKVEKPTTIARAKIYCLLCSGRKKCLDLALATNEESGIWGGLTYEERKMYIVKEALKAGKDYAEQHNTLHVPQRPVYVFPSFQAYIPNVQIQIRPALSQQVEELFLYQVVLPRFL